MDIFQQIADLPSAGVAAVTLAAVTAGGLKAVPFVASGGIYKGSVLPTTINDLFVNGFCGALLFVKYAVPTAAVGFAVLHLTR